MPDSTATITVSATDLASSVLEAVGTSLQGLTDSATTATGPLGDLGEALDATGTSASGRLRKASWMTYWNSYRP